MERGLDVVVLLHGDGQYAPEMLPEMVAPVVRGECDAVMGSRMMEKGAARRGGMPLYNLVGNRILTRAENAMLGARFPEFAPGCRASTPTPLPAVPFHPTTAHFHSDTSSIVRLTS